MRISDAKKIANLSEWRRVVERQRQSGLSIRAWCEENHFTEQQFYYRLRHVREAVLGELETVPKAELVRLTGLDCPISNTTSQEGGTIVVRYQAVSIEFPSEIDMQKLACLLKELGR